MKIDFTRWTDMQLDAYKHFASTSPNGHDMLNEIAQRKKAGVWMSDGSKERVESLLTQCKPRRRR